VYTIVLSLRFASAKKSEGVHRYPILDFTASPRQRQSGEQPFDRLTFDNFQPAQAILSTDDGSEKTYVARSGALPSTAPLPDGRDGRITLTEQWASATTREETLPRNRRSRDAPLAPMMILST